MVDAMKVIPYIAISLIAILVLFIGCIDRDDSTSYYQPGINSQIPKTCPNIRVLLGTADSLSITSSSTRNLNTDNNDISSVVPPTANTWKIELIDNKWTINGKTINTFASDLELAANDDYSYVNLNAYDSGKPKVNGKFRGTIKCIARPYGKMAIVNTLKLELYLESVVGSEVYAHWHLDALRAQSIAARSYAIWQMNMNSRKLWDLGSTQASQCYKGVAAENDRISLAVNQTTGLVLTTNEHGRESILPAFYSAVCGGSTQSAGPVFGYFLPELPAKQCPYCKPTTPPQQYSWPNVYLSKKYVSDRLSKKYKLGEIQTIIPSKKNSFGRIEQLYLYDVDGHSTQVKAEDFRLDLYSPQAKILSSLYDIEEKHDRSGWIISNGHGWGHGVGLCQRGAQHMAATGQNDIQILSFYYPQSKVKKAY